MTVQNEPEYAAPWEACAYSAEQERDFVKHYLGPIMKENHPDMKVVVFDHNKDHIVQWADTIFGDNDTSQYVWGIGFHWYSGDEFEHLEQVHTKWPQKQLLPTEGCICPGVSLDNWTRGEVYGHDIMGDLNNWAVGWTDWNIVLNLQGGPNHLGNLCDAFLIADTDAQALHYQPAYYYFGHFSRYLTPGSKRVGLSITTSAVPSSPLDSNSNTFTIEATAFITPTNEVVVIIMNRYDQALTFKLKSSLTSTSAAAFTIQAHSILTLSYKE